MIRVAWLSLVLLVAVFVAYWPTFNAYFLADDFGYVSHFRGMPLGEMPWLVADDWSQGTWGFNQDEIRPTTALIFWIDSHMWGGNPFGYHVTNVIVHALNVTLVFVIALALTRRNQLASFAAALFFALSTAAIEPVSWITSRTMSIGALFFLAAFVFVVLHRSTGRRPYFVLLSMAYLLALFSHEMALTFPLLVAGFDLFSDIGRSFYRRRARALSLFLLNQLPVLLLLIAYVLLRRVALGSAVRENRLDTNSVLDFISRQEYFYGEIFPPLKPLFGLLPVDTYSDPGRALIIALAILLILVLLYNLRRPNSPRLVAVSSLLCFAFAWPVITLLPTIVTDNPEAGRYLYLPTAGVSAAIALVLAAPFWQSLVRLRPGARHVSLWAGSALTILLAAGFSLYVSSNDWVKAGYVSRQIAAELQSASRNIPSDQPVIVNVPRAFGKAYLWAWSLPYALEEPFLNAGFYQEHEVLEQPDLWRCLDCWHRERRELLSGLLTSQKDPVMLYVDGTKPAWRTVRATDLPAAWRSAATLQDHSRVNRFFEVQPMIGLGD